MRIVHHVKNKDKGLLILESKPAYRTVLSGKNELKPIRVPFPYLNYIFRYTVHNNKIIYPGVYGAGMIVFGSHKPLRSFRSQVFNLPNEMKFKGAICTNHGFDGASFNSLKNMVDFCLTDFWGKEQNASDIDGKWLRTPLDKLNTLPWKKVKLFQLLTATEKIVKRFQSALLHTFNLESTKPFPKNHVDTLENLM